MKELLSPLASMGLMSLWLLGICGCYLCVGRGDFGVNVASAFAPNDWEEFRLVADGISRWDASQPGPQCYTLETFEPILRSRLERLQEALSKERFEATLNNAVKVHNDSVDEYSSRLRESGVIPKFIEYS